MAWERGLTALLATLLIVSDSPRQAAAQPVARTGSELVQEAVTGPRDATVPATGTARLSGRVVGGDTGRPLRRAQVRLQGDKTPEGVSVLTDERGRFEFKDLAAGRYMLFATRSGYVTVAYGQRRATESPKPLDLAAGQRLDNIDFNLAPGGVIAGRITDELGEPVASIDVSVLRHVVVNGRRTLLPASFSQLSDSTDDLGRFRIFGLPAGDYIISAGMNRFNQHGMASWDVNEGRVRTYFPGTPTLGDAQRVRLGAGEEITSVNFALVAARPATIRGTIIDSSGRPLTGGHLMVEESDNLLGSGGGAQVQPDGTFTLKNLSPGTYVLHVGVDGDDGESASVQVSVASEDIEDLTIVTVPPATIVGQLLFESEPTKAVKPGEFQFMTVPAGGTWFFGGGHVEVKDDWTFEGRVRDGPVFLRAAALPEEWMLKAVSHGGADVTDRGIEFRPGEHIDSVQVLLTNRIASVQGGVTDRGGKRVDNYAVIVFADDPSLWRPRSRHLFVGRPSQQGRYRISKLPAGHYLAAALDSVDEGQPSHPEFLERLRPGIRDP